MAKLQKILRQKAVLPQPVFQLQKRKFVRVFLYVSAFHLTEVLILALSTVELINEDEPSSEVADNTSNQTEAEKIVDPKPADDDIGKWFT